ncbi:DUF6081 family protein [Streptomyces sp. DSM 44917]|uniref:DUF6081 family protein n=1 Tax=Streptomyces boetiae TaxID=3075541 RepID=A0ABU2L5H9_9ACTN|nr:DUF6081 family protein [Streptomyces sp. DSM 44917]MDT0306488.1 DUF6081 family protein [Streptomyces sp. DSM 44917]
MTTQPRPATAVRYGVDPDLRGWAEQGVDADFSDVAAARAVLRAAAGRRAPYRPAHGPVSVAELTVPGTDVRVRVHRPEKAAEPLPALLFMHGGAFMAGGPDNVAATADEFADRAGIAVVSVDYRLAPEHPYPAAFDDCWAALQWLARDAASLGCDPARIGVGGESAGGGLAAALALAARDRGGPALRCQLLVSAQLDDRLLTGAALCYSDTPRLRRADLVSSWQAYLGGCAGPVPYYAAPARADDLGGLPPAFVAVTEFDPLRDENLDFALRLIRADVRTRLRHYPGTLHLAWAHPEARVSREMRDDQVAALRDTLAGDTGQPGAGAGPGSAAAIPLFFDDFRTGLRTEGPEARWKGVSFGAYAADDGVVRHRGGELCVRASGVHPKTGEPAFARGVSPQDRYVTGLPGTLDHVKWLAFTDHMAGSGFPGYDAPASGQLVCEAVLSGRTFGTAEHPFGAEVTDPEDDLRLACTGLPVQDFETSLTLNFLLTNRRVYAVYERLPLSRAALGPYASFAYHVPVAERSPEDWHRCRIAYDRRHGVLRWTLDGREVLTVEEIGRRLPERYADCLAADHGGEEETVRPRQFNAGLGLFTALDHAGPGQRGLVRLSSEPGYYLSTSQGPPAPQEFAHDEAPEKLRLFGQGAEARLRSFTVFSLPAH